MSPAEPHQEMPVEVRLPDLGDGVVSAKVVTWLKKVGDVVAAGQVIAEVETDKTNVEIEAQGSGVLQEILVPVGASAGVGDLLAVITAQITSGRSSDSPAERIVPTPPPQVVKPAMPDVPAMALA